MTKVAGVPEQLRSLSAALGDAAPELERAASALASVSLPVMPPGVGSLVSDTLGRVGERPRRVALTIDEEGLDVGRRRIWLEIAGQGGMLVTLHPPCVPGGWQPLPGFGFDPGPDIPLPPLPPDPKFPGITDVGPQPGLTLPGITLLPGFTPRPDPPRIVITSPRDQPWPSIMYSDDGGEEGGGGAAGPTDAGGEGGDDPIVIQIPRGRWPDAEETIQQGEEEGHPAEGEIDREGAAERRRERLRDVDPVPGKDRDEWPPAVLRPDEPGHTVRPTDPHDNRGMGSHIGGRIRTLPDGTRVRIELEA